MSNIPNNSGGSAPKASAPLPGQQAQPAADQQVGQGNQVGKPPQAPQAPAKTFKIKVDGVEETLTESEILQLAQMGKSSNKRFQEAAAAKRQAEEVVGWMKSNPKEAFKKLGIDVRKFSEDTLLEMINQEKMSPEQKRAHENEQRLKQYEAQEKAAKDKAHKDKLAAMEQEHMQNFDQMFTQALTESGLPKTAYTVKRMAELAMVNVKKKLDLQPSQLAKIVRQDYENEIKALYGQADGDTLLNLLGKEAVKKLSKAQLSKYKANAPKSQVSNSGSRDQQTPASNPVANWKAFKKKNRTLI